MNSLLHYLLARRRRRRRSASNVRHLLKGTECFDEAFYRSQCPDLADDADALEHYLAEGWRAGLDPAEAFSTSRYLTADPDELDNLAVKSEHGAVLRRLRAAAIAELRRTNAGFVDGMPAVCKGA